MIGATIIGGVTLASFWPVTFPPLAYVGWSMAVGVFVIVSSRLLARCWPRAIFAVIFFPVFVSVTTLRDHYFVGSRAVGLLSLFVWFGAFTFAGGLTACLIRWLWPDERRTDEAQ